MKLRAWTTCRVPCRRVDCRDGEKGSGFVGGKRKARFECDFFVLMSSADGQIKFRA
jgi:hypothetical protein